MTLKSAHNIDLTPERPHGPDGTYLEAQMRYHFICEFLADNSADRGLDIACGEGYGVDILLPKFRKITGIDYDENALSIARQRLIRENKAEFLKMDVSSLDFPDGHFDVVCANEIIEHIKEPRNMLREIKRVLKSGGMLFLTTPNRIYTDSTPLGMNPFHVREYTSEELKELLAGFFTIKDFYGIFFRGRKFEQTGLFRVYHAVKKAFGLEKFRFSGSLREKLLKDLNKEDYSISRSGVEKCLNFLAVCVKQ